MIRVGIDINEANVENKVGSNQYAFEIINALYETDIENNYLLYSSRPIRPDLPQARKNWQYRVIPPAKLWTQWRLPLQLFLDRKKLDVFFTPGHYAPRLSPIPTVVAIMDLAYLKFPDFFLSKDVFQLTAWTKYSVQNAKKVIAISQATKNDVMKYYGRKSSDVIIAYPGFSPSHKSLILNPKSPALPYILFVGTIQPRKNLGRLIKAFEMLTTPHDLVIAGKQGWLADEVYQAINSSPKREKIKLMGFVAEAELPKLYQESSCVVMPGLYEGFGIPALEAIHYGSLPVISQTGSLPEVVGESAITFDPYSPTSISKSIQKAVQLTPAEKQKLLAKYQAHAKTFDWLKSAKIIMEVLQNVTLSRSQ